MLTDYPRVYPGLVGLVRKIQDRFKLAVVTTTSLANVTTVLKSVGLDAAFPLIIAREDVSRPKPHPEAYRKALLKLKIRPTECVALEDSPSGLASAQAAGIRAIAVGHRRAMGDWVGGSAFLMGLDDLEAVLSAIGV